MTDPQTTGNPGNPGAQAVQAVQQVSREGALRRVWRWLVGSHPRLRESEGRTSWLSYMLMLVQSMTLVLIGGSVELRTLMSGASLPEMTLMALSLGILVLSTYAADMATQRTMGRIGILLRNRRTLMATEHILYVAFVVGVEMATFGIALIGIELNPKALLSGTSILPSTLLVIVVMVGVRALIVGWTSIQLKIIAEPLPANELTLMRSTVEKAGGHAEGLLDELRLTARDLPTVMNAIAEMSKPPRRAPWWGNAWLRRRDEVLEREQDALRQRQIASLQALTRDEVAEVRVQAEATITAVREEAQRQMEATQAEARQHIETTQRQIEQANASATQRALDAILALVAGGTLPDWLTAQRPDLADFTLASVAGSGAGRRSSGSGGKSGAGSTRVERQRAFLVEQGIEPSSAPEGRRGVWLRASDLATLTGGRSGSERPQDLIRRLGDGATVGRNLVAPFEPVMRELSERHLLSDAARMWWTSQAHSGEDMNANQDDMSAASRTDVRGNVIAMRA